MEFCSPSVPARLSTAEVANITVIANPASPDRGMIIVCEPAGAGFQPALALETQTTTLRSDRNMQGGCQTAPQGRRNDEHVIRNEKIRKRENLGSHSRLRREQSSAVGGCPREYLASSCAEGGRV